MSSSTSNRIHPLARDLQAPELRSKLLNIRHKRKLGEMRDGERTNHHISLSYHPIAASMDLTFAVLLISASRRSIPHILSVRARGVHPQKVSAPPPGKTKSQNQKRATHLSFCSVCLPASDLACFSFSVLRILADLVDRRERSNHEPLHPCARDF